MLPPDSDSIMSDPEIIYRYGFRLFRPALLLPLLIVACTGNEGAPQEAAHAGEDSSHMTMRKGGYDFEGLAAFRASKDSGFRADDSPIPEAERWNFAGLEYYPVDTSFVFRVPLEKLPEPEPVEILGTGGEVRRMTRYGRLTFAVDGTEQTLTAYKSASAPEILFIPFKDATNTGETYGGGRYLDLDEHEGEEPYVLDFNLAYNPYCAYNETYTCPIVPKENFLAVAIPAGERLPAHKK